MKSLEEIKEEYAYINGFASWGVLFGCGDFLESHFNNVTKMYAHEVAEQTQINCFNACIEGSEEGPESALEAILNKSNIPSL